ncbi:beta-N-acetylhexosaminidase [Pseudoxanthomonas kalamensis DSM 18571]|uniref:beta-N-acetylhexosaminidase n=1 Tax=Pseudoxanthomonas kalamensis TaxID=289483 RepID=UPI0013920013|nr:family 20 glycosylhydrolase [Pseudoxanthomonas kalamensis]KAF1712128.1 beta-N-acetylhexosaminidase [Pseudoxanthomonas kalamensis DSM 18571]
MNNILSFSMALLLSVAGVPAFAQTLLPVPSHVTFGKDSLPLNGQFRIEFSGKASNNMLATAAARFVADVNTISGQYGMAANGPLLKIECCTSETRTSIDLPASAEAYSLQFSRGELVLKSDTQIGVLRGLATLRQLVYQDDDGAHVRVASIQDAPRFAWRGLMIDTARHFMSVAAIKRQIDAMEIVKLNVLHLHLSDNEAFRIQSLQYPKLTEATNGDFYTQGQIRDLVAYAADRGVTIVPEIDLPGHTAAMIAAYPFLASAPGAQVGLTGPAINPIDPKTYELLDNLVKEIAGLFPSPYFHAGGDEVSGADWAQSETIQAFMAQNGLADKTALQAYFLDRLSAIVKKHDKKLLGWEDVIHGETPDDIVIQTWKSSTAVAKATGTGKRVIVSSGYYLDHLNPSAFHYQVDPLDPTAYALDPDNYNAIKAAFPEISTFFSDDMLKVPGLKLDPSQSALVIGGEAPIWSEIVTDEMLDGRVWPRLAAVGERLWSPAATRDIDDLHARLFAVQDLLRTLGLQDRANQERMLSRIAPGDTGPAATLLEVTAPVRNFAHMHAMRDMMRGQTPSVQHFNQLADAASPDSQPATHFVALVNSLVAGDASVSAEIKSMLIRWQANHAAFAASATRHPALRSALPVSETVEKLCSLGLEALALHDSGAMPDETWTSSATTLLNNQDLAAKASESVLSVMMAPTQPPADLLITIVPAIHKLTDLAKAGNH